MITLLGSPRRCCDGVTRRETLKAGALSLLGGFFNLPSLLALESQSGRVTQPGKARSVILLYLLGGAATQDMFDLKPHAPDGIRSAFRPIATNVPGIQICELLPHLAQRADRYAIIRSMHCSSNDHGIAGTIGLTGSEAGGASLGGQVQPGGVPPNIIATLAGRYLTPEQLGAGIQPVEG